MKYKKRPVMIEAVLFEGFDSITGKVIFGERPDWLESAIGKTVLFFDEPNALSIVTLEGVMLASIGDYIIKGLKGELYPCKPDIFEESYEAV